MSDTNIKVNEMTFTKKDVTSDQMVKWCPGCGDHAILSSFLKVLPQLGKKKEDIAVISGIGCSSRFPYYVDTYGFHGIHGRAAALATGVKVANPNLSVWMVSGDGDSLAIGGNHFIHVLRRNIDLNILLLNNRIYGLTKGQYSPTTPVGKVTKTSPQGTIEHPFNPGELAIGAEASFFARTIDNNPKMMQEVMLEAENHNGTSLIEIMQDCIIFYHGAHSYYADRENRADRTIHLKDGEKMIFGKEKNKGLILDETNHIKAVTIGENGITEEDILVHNAKTNDPGMHMMLTTMEGPDLPVALGVIRTVDAPVYNDRMDEVLAYEKENGKIKSVDDLLNSGNTWEV